MNHVVMSPIPQLGKNNETEDIYVLFPIKLLTITDGKQYRTVSFADGVDIKTPWTIIEIAAWYGEHQGAAEKEEHIRQRRLIEEEHTRARPRGPVNAVGHTTMER